jgi:hypothetical protein
MLTISNIKEITAYKVEIDAFNRLARIKVYDDFGNDDICYIKYANKCPPNFNEFETWIKERKLLIKGSMLTKIKNKFFF